MRTKFIRHFALPIAFAMLTLGGCGDDDGGSSEDLLSGLECVRRTDLDALIGPNLYDASIERYEQLDRDSPPDSDAIVFIGSSSIVFWSTLADDMAPLPVLNRGFGGSVTSQAVGYADRIVVPYQPRAVVLYEGDNDIAFGISPDCVLEDFRRFAQAVPEVPIYFLSIKPAPSRASLWSTADYTNRLIEALADTDSRLHYIDVATPLFDDSGAIRGELFLGDDLHMNAGGYREWTAVVRPILLADLSD